MLSIVTMIAVTVCLGVVTAVRATGVTVGAVDATLAMARVTVVAVAMGTTVAGITSNDNALVSVAMTVPVPVAVAVVGRACSHGNERRRREVQRLKCELTWQGAKVHCVSRAQL